MAIHYAKGKTTASARLRVVLVALIGLLVAILTGNHLSWSLAPLLGWDAAAGVYILWVWAVVWNLDGHDTAAHAVREDPSRGISDTIVMTASVASLIAVGMALLQASHASGSHRLLLVLLGVVSVVVAWTVVHTLFALRYAELYYGGERGGVDFPRTPQPTYQDFAYLAFTLGMTFQVSDTGFQTTEFRRTALHHSLISYLFGTVIVATTINLIAGLTA